MEQRTREYLTPRPLDLTLSSGLAAVYVVTTFFPLTPFIGGPAFITLEIVMLPVIAALLRPPLATVTVFVGSLGMALGQASFYQIFGLAGLLIPIVAVATGSLPFHYRLGPIVPWTYVLAGAVFYVLFSKGGTLYWLVPYALVLFSLPATLRIEKSYRIWLLSLYTAMSEQVTMNVLSILLLGLVGPVWVVITPFMYAERTLATVGGATAIVALKSRLGTKLDTSPQVLEEVKYKRCV